MRRTLLLTVLAVILTAWPTAAQTGVAVPPNRQQIYIPAVSSPLPIESPVETPILARSVRKGRPMVLPALYFSLAALQGADLYSTQAALANGASVHNPLLKKVGGGSMGQVAVKGALTASSILVAERLWRKNKRVAAVVSMVAVNSLMAAVVHNNVRNARR